MALHPFVTTAVKAARNAGNAIMRGYTRPDLIRVQKKGHKDFVTDIDRLSEETIIHTLQTAYPNHCFLSEEAGKLGLSSDYQWIIDPLDGTVNFIHGFPHFCVSIALSYRGRIEHAVIYDPVRDDLFTASRGEGAQRSNRRIRTSGRHLMEDCLIGTGTPSPAEPEWHESYYQSYHAISKECLAIRRSGSSALDLVYVAAGILDGYWKLGLKIWDLAAASLIIREAGGLISDFQGSEDYFKQGHVVAANPKFFKPFLKKIQPFFHSAKGSAYHEQHTGHDT